jgi:hypothetical protein
VSQEEIMQHLMHSQSQNRMAAVAARGRGGADGSMPSPPGVGVPPQHMQSPITSLATPPARQAAAPAGFPGGGLIDGFSGTLDELDKALALPSGPSKATPPTGAYPKANSGANFGEDDLL